LAEIIIKYCILFLKKTLSKAKYEYAKIQRETLLEDASALTFIDFGLLHSTQESRTDKSKIFLVIAEHGITQSVSASVAIPTSI